MMFTEEEARTKWCPLERRGQLGYRCIASECMAWRKRESAKFKRAADAEFSKTGRRLESNEGYCGLAGAPND